MTNSFYNVSGAPGTGSQGSSSTMRGEFANIAAGFDKLPSLTGNGGKAVVVNAGGTALTVTSGALDLGGDLTTAAAFTTSGAFGITLTATAETALTLPTTGTLATRAGAEALTNKTISGSSNTLSNIGNSALTNSSVTVNGTSISLGSSGTVTAAAGTLTGTTLASGVTASSLTSVGTLTSLTVSGVATVSVNNATPLVVYRPSASVNVSIEWRNDTASWFAGQTSTGDFAIDTDATISATPRLSLSTGGNLSVVGSVTATTTAAVGIALSSSTTLALAASTTGVSSLRLPHGSAPSAPVNGDMWTTTSGLFVRIQNVTVGPLT